jgi:Maintenance of mitochondrial morphology protein 1
MLQMICTPPVPTANMNSQSVAASDAFPAVTFVIPPSSVSLRLKIASTIGSRAQLADMPKLHELIESQVRDLFIYLFIIL